MGGLGQGLPLPWVAAWDMLESELQGLGKDGSWPKEVWVVMVDGTGKKERKNAGTIWSTYVSAPSKVATLVVKGTGKRCEGVLPGMPGRGTMQWEGTWGCRFAKKGKFVCLITKACARQALPIGLFDWCGQAMAGMALTCSSPLPFPALPASPAPFR